MKFLVIFGVLFLTLFSYSSTEMTDDLESDVEDENVEAEDLLSLMANEQTRKECIPKHHECTHNKHGCCRGNLFKYKCSCQTVVIKGEESERCYCKSRKSLKALEMVYDLGKKFTSQ